MRHGEASPTPPRRGRGRRPCRRGGAWRGSGTSVHARARGAHRSKGLAQGRPEAALSRSLSIGSASRLGTTSGPDGFRQCRVTGWRPSLRRMLPDRPGRTGRTGHVDTVGRMIVAFSISPTAADETGGVSEAVAAAVRVVRESGLPNETNAMFTNIEGEWDEVMAVVKQAVDVVAAVSPRVGLVLKADIRPGFDGQLTAKVERVERALERLMAEPYAPPAAARPPPQPAASRTGGRAGVAAIVALLVVIVAVVGAAAVAGGRGPDVVRVGRDARATCTSTAGCSADHTEDDVRLRPVSRRSGDRTTPPGSTAGCTTCRCATRTPSTRSSTARSGSPTTTTLSEDDVAELERAAARRGHPVAVPRAGRAGRRHRLGAAARARVGRRPAAGAVPRGVRRRAHRAGADGVLRGWRRRDGVRRGRRLMPRASYVVDRRWPRDRPRRRGAAARRRRLPSWCWT